MDGQGQLTFVRIGTQAEINMFEVRGNTQAARQTPCLGAAGSTISASRRRRWLRTTRSIGASSTEEPPMSS
jgi:hypothetical protein